MTTWITERTDNTVTSGSTTVGSVSTGLLDADNIRIDGNTISSTDTNGDIALSPDGTGRVGVGTVTPSTLLNIKSTAAASVVALIESSADQEASLRVKNSRGEGWEFKADDGTDKLSIAEVGDAVRMTILAGGNVGIGTSVPDAILNINGIGSDEGGDEFFHVRQGATSAFIVDGSRKVGIGTATPERKLHVQTSDQVIADFRGSSTGGFLDIENGSNDVRIGIFTNNVFGIDAGGDATNKGHLNITTAGNVGIGTDAPTSSLHIDQSSTSGAKPVLRLDQGDVDDSFIDFIGTSDTDGSNSISSDTSTDSAKFGAIRIEINGATKWIRIYDDHS